MINDLHKNTRTPPASRDEFAGSTDSAANLARRNGVNEGTLYKWKGRDKFHDASHTWNMLQSTLTPAQKLIMVEQRKILLLPLADLLAVTRGFLYSQAARSGPNRFFRRYDVPNLIPTKPKKHALPHKSFKCCKPGLIHIDIKYMPQIPDETSRRYLFMAIARGTRWAYPEIKSNKKGAATRPFQSVLHKTHRFTLGKDLDQPPMRYLAHYKHLFPQPLNKNKTPTRTMKDLFGPHRHLFVKRWHDHPGCEI